MVLHQAHSSYCQVSGLFFMFVVQHYLCGWLPFNMDFCKVENAI